MSGKRANKVSKVRTVSRRSPPKAPQPDLSGSIKPGAKKYGVPVLKNIGLAGIALTCAFIVFSQSDRIARLAQEVSPITRDEVPKTGNARIVGNNVPIRSIPKINGKILERAVWGDSVEVIGKEGEWAQIRSAKKNTTGWISQAELKF
jgi:hypothetical protein